MPSTMQFSTAIVYIFISVITLINAINPQWMWEKCYGGKGKATPSKEQFKMRRIGAAITFIIVNFMILYPFFQ